MKWDLSYLYENDQAWDKAYDFLKERIEIIPQYEGRLSDSTSFKAYFLLQKEIAENLYTVYQYAALKSDLNKKIVENASRVQKIASLVAKLQKLSAFESPEVIALGEKVVMGFIEKDPVLRELTFPMERLFHSQKHVLSNVEESLLANFSQLGGSGSEIYTNLTVADRSNEEVTLKNGETVTITPGNWTLLMTDLEDEDDRETVFSAFYRYYLDHKNAYAQVYKTVLDSDIASVKSRGYQNSLEMYLSGNKIDPSVFHNIVEVAKDSTHLLKRYYEIRKKALGLKSHRTFDRFRPLAKSHSKFTYEEAKELFLKSVDHLSDDFKAKAKEALEDGFVDVYEQDGKRTGAYSWGAVNKHPYILLNYDETLNSVFTLAHEAGHSMHSLYAAENQPSSTQDYTIFVAEIASTFNEHLLLDYFIQNNKGTQDDEIVLLQQAIDDIMGTFYRQVLFAAYEYEAHTLAENEAPITHESLSKIMETLYLDFYDIDISKEPGTSYEWAYIPHLYHTPFYVYQYATSFAASLKMYELVKKDPKNIAMHTKLLASGGSDWPLHQISDSGIDLTTKEPFLAVVKRLETLLDRLELALEL